LTEPTKPWVTIRHDIPFHDVDMLEVVWHGHYYKYFELARTALFRKYGLDVAQMRAMGHAMVVIDSRCRYFKPLRYGRDVEILAVLEELEIRLEIDYLIRDPETGQKLAKGRTIQVTTNPGNGEMFFNTPQEIVSCFNGGEER